MIYKRIAAVAAAVAVLAALLMLVSKPTAAAPLRALPRVVQVGAGGSPAQNGQALVNALADIAVANPAPSATTPYLLKLGPGVYDVSAAAPNYVQMLDFVDIEGSGQGITRIRGSGGADVTGISSIVFGSVVVIGANQTELRQLTVVNTSSISRSSAAISVVDSSMRLTDITAVAGTVTSNGSAFAIGVDLAHVDVDTVLISRVTAIAKGSTSTVAIFALVAGGGDEVSMTEVRATSDNAAIGANGHRIEVRNSVLDAPAAAGSDEVRIFTSLISGIPGTNACHLVYSTDIPFTQLC